MKRLHFFYFQFFLLIALGCGSTKETSEKTSNLSAKCDTWVLVRDYSGLDGCSNLLLLENGKKLLPVKGLPSGLMLKEGQQFMIGYKEQPGMASICMAEDMTVKITCMEDAEGDNKRPCVNTDDPMDVPWMKEQERLIDPPRIIRYVSGEDHFIYQFDKGKDRYFFDCTGVLLCFTPEGEEVCPTVKYSLGKSTVIWVVNN